MKKIERGISTVAYERYLLTRINEMRKMMIETAKKYGMNHKKTIHISQELDVLVLKYQLMKV